ncbi:MAG: methyltransferase domain-containing protein [Phycisphaerales bacterium]
MSGYSNEFFRNRAAAAAASADVVAPLLIRWVNPRSVIDIGCGTGSWLAAFQRAGVNDILGLDGDYVDRAALEISADHFRPADVARPLDINGRTYDLAVSLEVGEHLPPESSATLVDSLTRAAPVVFFSAAIPLQGGTGHINERWQHQWADLFAQRNYLAVDAVRPIIWSDERVSFWYRQNALIYVRESELSRYPELAAARARTNDQALSLVHPRLLEKRNRKPIRSFKAGAVAAAWWRAVRGR